MRCQDLNRCDSRASRGIHAWRQRLALALALPITMVAYLSQSDADILWVKGDDQPRFGRVAASDDKTTMRFHQRIASGKYQSIQIPLSQVDRMIVTIDRDRIRTLTPEHPADYRDLAEDLVKFSWDPESRDLAIRLFTISGYLADQLSDARVRESALRNLHELARSEDERKRIANLASVYQIHLEEKDRSAHPDSWANGVADWLELVQAVRREAWSDAERLLTQVQDDERQTFVLGGMTVVFPDDLQKIIGRRTVSIRDLDWLLQWELWLRGERQLASDVDRVPWSMLADRVPVAEWIPDWDQLNEFNPRLNMFHEGEWVGEGFRTP